MSDQSEAEDSQNDEPGLGDLLYGLFPDEDADSVEEVREARDE